MVKQSEQTLSPEDSTQYRALVARANYLAQDRADICFAVKELCKRMSKPNQSDWKALKILGRYLVDKARLTVRYDDQPMPHEVEVTVDTDFAGSPTTRKSTSGGGASKATRRSRHLKAEKRDVPGDETAQTTHSYMATHINKTSLRATSPANATETSKTTKGGAQQTPPVQLAAATTAIRIRTRIRIRPLLHGRLPGKL